MSMVMRFRLLTATSKTQAVQMFVIGYFHLALFFIKFSLVSLHQSRRFDFGAFKWLQSPLRAHFLLSTLFKRKSSFLKTKIYSKKVKIRWNMNTRMKKTIQLQSRGEKPRMRSLQLLIQRFDILEKSWFKEKFRSCDRRTKRRIKFPDRQKSCGLT